MEIYSFSGPSGTGKSWNALELAHRYKIEGIIDDGLLIINGEIIAGSSAKFEKSIFKAVKRAIFHDEEQAYAVRTAIKEQDLKRLLIIGTSDKMTERIARELQLGEIDHYHYIEELRSPKEMKMAQFIRKTEGKHIMPIPMMQVQQNFFKRLVMKGFEIFSTKREKIGETTIVQPDFHHELVLYQKKDFLDAIKRSCLAQSAVLKVNKVQFTLYPLPKGTVTITYDATKTANLIANITILQQQINTDFDAQFALEFDHINIEVHYLAEKETIEVLEIHKTVLQ
ncbi:ATP-binding protein [Kurthia sibirica]|uniref:ATP-binding protein n=1 Tax=Kurthia sibirica TaxID=202750 RepID=UPI00117419E3|nr:ATP-binding protein [Kurthia sibirica]GEK34583.1 ATPase [Kurthia sibirica]